ncbi:class I SAM-dependent methyltransferase [Reinekea marinisedimentorum]|uniref:16S rRNA (Guanine1207-N2)-methyltransferase n=1 Tax=Reinekea marinisedimentorum TaxID=230495 RepID=A0A4R3I7S9_9GAMM|nr:class I SAM-dependent methyltransferase [Reinekea marinisedimentorum]TCS41345.1 16S rRNA (guanine1207-N2)-methyltransferase [Reinekea marinisedimentorum]
MHPTFQLLERHSDTLANSTTNWFDAPEQSPLVKPSDKQFNLNFSQTNHLQADCSNIETTDINVLFFPKAKDRLDWWLNNISALLQSGQQLWVVGENNGGIKSLAKRVNGEYDCLKVDSARHCALFELRPVSKPDDYQEWRSYDFGNRTIYSLPGVFSAGKLDKGTELLLKNLPRLKGKVFEFGSGAGVLTLALAELESVKNVVTVDIDVLAVRSTQKTAQQNNLEDKIQAIWSAGTTAVNAQKFDFIITNPPFHQGIKTAYAPTEEFFSQAHNWLKPKGKLIWVANDFLAYEPCLQGNFDEIKTLAREKGFKVMEAVRS